MPTPQQIRAELDADPLGLGYAALVAAGDDTALAASLNAPAYRGPVPIEELASYCCRKGITGGVMALIEIPIGAEIAPGVAMAVATKAMLHTVLTLIQLDYRLSTADVDDPAFGAACDGLIALGVMASGDKTAIMAMADGRLSRAGVLWGAGVSATQVGEARNS